VFKLVKFYLFGNLLHCCKELLWVEIFLKNLWIGQKKIKLSHGNLNGGIESWNRWNFWAKLMQIYQFVASWVLVMRIYENSKRK
jgi:hypothetical protein